MTWYIVLNKNSFMFLQQNNKGKWGYVKSMHGLDEIFLENSLKSIIQLD